MTSENSVDMSVYELEITSPFFAEQQQFLNFFDQSLEGFTSRTHDYVEKNPHLVLPGYLSGTLSSIKASAQEVSDIIFTLYGQPEVKDVDSLCGYPSLKELLMYVSGDLGILELKLLSFKQAEAKNLINALSPYRDSLFLDLRIIEAINSAMYVGDSIAYQIIDDNQNLQQTFGLDSIITEDQRSILLAPSKPLTLGFTAKRALSRAISKMNSNDTIFGIKSAIKSLEFFVSSYVSNQVEDDPKFGSAPNTKIKGRCNPLLTKTIPRYIKGSYPQDYIETERVINTRKGVIAQLSREFASFIFDSDAIEIIRGLSEGDFYGMILLRRDQLIGQEDLSKVEGDKNQLSTILNIQPKNGPNGAYEKLCIDSICNTVTDIYSHVLKFEFPDDKIHEFLRMLFLQKTSEDQLFHVLHLPYDRGTDLKRIQNLKQFKDRIDIQKNGYQPDPKSTSKKDSQKDAEFEYAKQRLVDGLGFIILDMLQTPIYPKELKDFVLINHTKR